MTKHEIKIITIFCIAAVLMALTIYMISARPGLTFDAYAKKCEAVGGVVVILQHQRICVKQSALEEIMV